MAAFVTMVDRGRVCQQTTFGTDTISRMAAGRVGPASFDAGISVLDLERVIIGAGRPDMGLGLWPADLLQALEGVQLGDFC